MNNGMFHECMNVVPKQIVRRLFEYPNANPKLYDSQVNKLSNNNNDVPKKDVKMNQRPIPGKDLLLGGTL